MLRQVLIYKEVRIYFTHFGKALDEESFNSVLKKLQQEAFVRGRDPNAVGSYDFYKYRISYIAEPKQELLFIFVTDLTDAVENIKTQLEVCKREFIELFGDVLDSQFDAETFDVFQPTLEKIHKELRPKISLVGFSGVGKTTITHLIRAEEIPMEHVPTITGEIGVIKIGKLSFALWDFAGQEQFSFLWNKFVKGSDAVLLITDSTLENVEKSRFFTELVKQEAPHAHVAVIGNKQDLPGAMPTPEIERMLGGIHAYSMVATDPANRDKMITIIADILEMSAEVSPLLKPLIDRDKKMVTAEDALMNGDFQSAFQLFNEIADLCLELGDDSLSQEFHEKSEKVKGYLSQSGQAVSAPPMAEASPEPPALFNYEEPQEAPAEEMPEAPTEDTPHLSFEVFESPATEEGAGEESEEAPVRPSPRVAL
ncbi:MAG TPA: ADP-ribosylation factor-like protein, partial [Candidatus Lokiarchaeia archaeon]|nr:ADP-ribosylation factor-like protein [Candidatus Lokiarchaeia archaeon]